MIRHVHRVTKYDPADRDDRGCYTGPESEVSDHGPGEDAYLRAVAAFAAEAGVDRLAIREPQVGAFVHFGLEPPAAGHGLAGLFPADLAGYHDGAIVALDVALELVRAMLRDSGAWCRLEAADRFTVHVGWDQYLYIGSALPCPGAVARTRALGLFPERLDASPYAFDQNEADEPGIAQRPADEVFWARVRGVVDAGRAVILEEVPVANATRWHRVARATVEAVRARLAPRAQLTVWADLFTDVGVAVDALRAAGSAEVLREDPAGRITGRVVDEEQVEAATAWLVGARAAGVVPLVVDERRPLFTAVLPDADGVLRARWRTEPTRSDRDWAFLASLRRGQEVTGTVAAVGAAGVVSVDLGGFRAELESPGAFVVGCRVTAEVVSIDLVRERLRLSLRDPG